MTFRLVDQSPFIRIIHIAVQSPYIAISQISGKLKLCFLRARQRRQLLALSDHALKDIGVTRADAMTEASKPFWKE